MKIKYFLLIISLAVSFCFVDFGSALAVTSTFSGDSVYPLDIKTPIYSLTISADINLKSDKSLVRVVLLDSKGAERIVYETYPLIADSNTFSIINACGETCVLNSVTPVSLKIQIVDATLNIKSVNSSGTALRGGTNQNQEASNIAKINAMIQRKGLNWTAGKTSVSGLSYEQKKKLFTNPDGTPVSELPNLQGFEYYKGGIFTVSAPSAQRSDATPAVSSGLPSSWDWRNVNGENWNTSVKDQGSAGTCWAHALMGTLEAQINLYYNQHLNLNLSEQQIVDCINEAASPYGMNQSNFQGCFGNNMCYPGYGYCSIGQHGIADESCDPYAATYDSRGQWPTHCDATYVCSDWQKRVWKNASFWDYKFVKDFGTQGCPTQTMNLSEGDFKKILISKGPLNSGYTPWNHAMVLVGYNTDGSTGETTWIYKNSWGSNFGENGYARIKATLADIGWGSLPIGPFTPPTNHAYWPAGFDGTIKCVDKDKDGYCNWGISEQKPSTCPSSCKPQKDCDDSNPKLGPFDVNFNCVAPPPTVTIVNPSVTANWSIGSSYPITWTSSRVSAVSVSLVNSNGVATPVSKMSIPTSIQNGLQWIVPATVTPGNYMLKVSDTDTGYTNISASLAITITVVSTRPTLSFTYPTVGAQLIQGKTYDIGWSSTGMNNAIISLVSGPSMNTISASAPMSSGKYTWTVPTTATVGSNYTIQIINKDAGSYENLSFSSPVFSIVAPAVYCGTLTLDAETNLCVEKPVADFLNSSFRTRIHTCDNCTNLPQLSISVDNGTQSAPLEVYLNNKKLLD